jgi:hypothetical protein
VNVKRKLCPTQINYMSIPAVVVGGSLGGLSSALALHCVNCDVDVFERSRGAMKSRAVASDNESPCCNSRQWTLRCARKGEVDRTLRLCIKYYYFPFWKLRYNKIFFYSGGMIPDSQRALVLLGRLVLQGGLNLYKFKILGRSFRRISWSTTKAIVYTITLL